MALDTSPAEDNLEILKGTTFHESFTFISRDDDGTETYDDLTTFNIRAYFQFDRETTPALTLTAGSGITIEPVTVGDSTTPSTLVLTITAAQTASDTFPKNRAGRYWVDFISGTNQNPIIETPIAGDFVVSTKS